MNELGPKIIDTAELLAATEAYKTGRIKLPLVPTPENQTLAEDHEAAFLECAGWFIERTNHPEVARFIGSRNLTRDYIWGQNVCIERVSEGFRLNLTIGKSLDRYYRSQSDTNLTQLEERERKQAELKAEIIKDDPVVQYQNIEWIFRSESVPTSNGYDLTYVGSRRLIAIDFLYYPYLFEYFINGLHRALDEVNKRELRAKTGVETAQELKPQIDRLKKAIKILKGDSK